MIQLLLERNGIKNTNIVVAFCTERLMASDRKSLIGDDLKSGRRLLEVLAGLEAALVLPDGHLGNSRSLISVEATLVLLKPDEQKKINQ